MTVIKFDKSPKGQREARAVMEALRETYLEGRLGDELAAAEERAMILGEAVYGEPETVYGELAVPDRKGSR